MGFPGSCNTVKNPCVRLWGCVCVCGLEQTTVEIISAVPCDNTMSLWICLCQSPLPHLTGWHAESQEISSSLQVKCPCCRHLTPSSGLFAIWATLLWAGDLWVVRFLSTYTLHLSVIQSPQPCYFHTCGPPCFLLARSFLSYHLSRPFSPHTLDFPGACWKPSAKCLRCENRNIVDSVRVSVAVQRRHDHGSS